jgi:hypothetical protein
LQLRFLGTSIGHHLAVVSLPTKAEDNEIVNTINDSRVDVVWVGLSTSQTAALDGGTPRSRDGPGAYRWAAR